MFQNCISKVVSELNLDRSLGGSELKLYLTPFDLKRLEAYANNQLDYHVVLDMIPTIAMLHFENRLGESVRATAVQGAILLALGLQRKTIEDVEVGVEYVDYRSA